MPDDRTYIRVHDGMDDHPKIEGLSDAAFRALHRCWFYCSRQLTDGRLTTAAWFNRAKTPKVRKELVTAHLVHEPGYRCPHPSCPPAEPGHVQMHDYLEHQRSAAEVAELKRKRSEAGRRGGQAKANAVASAKQVLQQTPSKTLPSTETDTEEQVLRGGSHVSSGPASAPPLYSDRCEVHGDEAAPPPCGKCADVRKANAVKPRLSLVGPSNPARVPHCGECDETRHRETPFGVIRCPECHPRAEESA